MTRRLGVIAIAIVVAACGSNPVPPTATPTFRGAPQGSPGATNAASQPTPGNEASTPLPSIGTYLPDEITGAVGALRNATSPDEAIAATTTLLTMAGVGVGDTAAALDSAAAMTVPQEQVDVMAREAMVGQTRASFSQFAVTLAGLALLPPNDTFIAQANTTGATPQPSAIDEGGSVNLSLNGQTGKLAGFLTKWVNTAAANYNASDAETAPLTAAPLLLAQLAATSRIPIDISQTFAPDDLQLDGLETTLLIAGMRSTLRHVAGVQAGAPSTRTVMARLVEDDSPCADFKAAADASIPQFTDAYSTGIGQTIQYLTEAFVGELLGEASNITQAVSPLFNTLGILARVQALAMLYSNAVVEVKSGRDEIHKGIGSNEEVSFHVKAGIPDDKWQAAKESRNLSPLSAALKACAALLGIPVLTDLVDIGDATASWRAEWDITHGSPEDAFFGEDQFFGPHDVAGRLERPLTRSSDHAGEDAVVVSIKPEEQSDHPGNQYSHRVVVCARVRTNPPPSVSTLINAGLVSTPLGGTSQLVAVLSDLIASWLQYVWTFDDCDDLSVTFHKAQPGSWHGKITVNTERQEQTSISQTTYVGPNFGTTVSTSTDRASVDVTDEFYVAGDDPEVGASEISLKASQFTHGAATFENHVNVSNGWTSMCGYDKQVDASAGGGWSINGDTNAGIILQGDGTYTLNWNAMGYDQQITVPGSKDTAVQVKTAGCEEHESGTEDWTTYPFPVVASVGNLLITGDLDPTNPGNKISGSLTSNNEDFTITTVTWDLTHDGPIHLPTDF